MDICLNLVWELGLGLEKANHQPRREGLAVSQSRDENARIQLSGRVVKITAQGWGVQVIGEAAQQQDGTDFTATPQVSSSRTNQSSCVERFESEKSARELRYVRLCLVFFFFFAKGNKEPAARHAGQSKILKRCSQRRHNQCQPHCRFHHHKLGSEVRRRQSCPGGIVTASTCSLPKKSAKF